MKVGKTAQWFANAKLPHSFTYVPDAAKALVMLAKRCNCVWADLAFTHCSKSIDRGAVY